MSGWWGSSAISSCSSSPASLLQPLAEGTATLPSQSVSETTPCLHTSKNWPEPLRHLCQDQLIARAIRHLDDNRRPQPRRAATGHDGDRRVWKRVTPVPRPVTDRTNPKTALALGCVECVVAQYDEHALEEDWCALVLCGWWRIPDGARGV